MIYVLISDGIATTDTRRAMAQEVNRRLLVAEARVQTQISPCEILQWTKWSWGRFSSEYFGCNPSVLFQQRSILMFHLPPTICNIISRDLR